jgi:hypothetical protein
MLSRLYSPVLALLSLLLLVYPVLHLIWIVQVWDTPALPADWTFNLGIALVAGIAGYLLGCFSWRTLRVAYGQPGRLAHSRPMNLPQR